MDQAQIRQARITAAKELGITTVKGRPFLGYPEDLGDLGAKDMIRVTDQMMLVLKRTPELLDNNQLKIVDRRINSPIFQQPLEATGIIPVTAELISSGELQKAMMQGAKDYVAGIGEVTRATVGTIIPKQVWIAGGVALVAYLWLRFGKK